MNVGMLWLDDDRKRSFEEKVLRAAAHYRDKYGCSPELCLVNSRMGFREKYVGRVEVKAAGTVIPNHFWLGMKS
jgi:hypothetical protein